jgi:hypothetical protein
MTPPNHMHACCSTNVQPEPSLPASFIPSQHPSNAFFAQSSIRRHHGKEGKKKKRQIAVLYLADPLTMYRNQ